MLSELDHRCRALAADLGLGQPEDIRAVQPLTGGVASDIARVDIGARQVCMKFALAKLKVAEEWRAPVARNAAEYAWLQAAAKILPESAVQLYGHSAWLQGFAMEFLDGDDIYLWKNALLEEAPDRGEAAQVGGMLGKVHAASTQPDFETSAFHNRDDFQALRIEPYLEFTANRHPDLAEPLRRLAGMLYYRGEVLVHGDVSPKNIFFRGGQPIILDAECATLGNACFDPAFCLNHLVLKAIHLPHSRPRLLTAVGEFWQAYAAQVTWEPASEVEKRTCELLPALMLARVDGKSPVEYLNDAARNQVRRLSIALIQQPAGNFEELVDRVATGLRTEKP